MEKGIYTIQLLGRFQLIAPDGKEVLVARKQSQALIAMLASEDRLTRPRAWLKDKLWSNSCAESSANKLRQTVFKTRPYFDDEKDKEIVISDRNVVGLNPDRVQVLPDGKGEFLEGFDMKDQEFENWLGEERRLHDRQFNSGAKAHIPSPSLHKHVHRTRRGLAIECANDPYSKLGQFETKFGDAVQRSIRETLDFEPVDPHGLNHRSQDVITFSIHAHHDVGGRICLRLAAYHGGGSGAIWADTANCDFPNSSDPIPIEMLNLSCRASATLTERLSQRGSGIHLEDDQNFFAGDGIRKMYSMLPGSIDQATKLISRANEIQSRGLYLALRAQLAVIDYVESEGANREELSEMSDEFCTKAIISEGTNSVVLSSVAHARLVFDDDRETAAELSKLSVVANPANPMAWSAWANVLLNTGKLEDAAKAAKMALNLSKGTYYRYWTEFQYATTAVALGQHGEATSYAERARALNPRYRPAMRYLVGLYANASKLDHAKSAMTRLQKQEAATTVDRFVNDHQYPVKMMRSAGLVDADKFSAIK